jgi:hypothetical protein
MLLPLAILVYLFAFVGMLVGEAKLRRLTRNGRQR